jgi:hypothetical protein
MRLCFLIPIGRIRLDYIKFPKMIPADGDQPGSVLFNYFFAHSRKDHEILQQGLL